MIIQKVSNTYYFKLVGIVIFLFSGVKYTSVVYEYGIYFIVIWGCMILCNLIYQRKIRVLQKQLQKCRSEQGLPVFPLLVHRLFSLTINDLLPAKPGQVHACSVKWLFGFAAQDDEADASFPFCLADPDEQ